MRKKTSLVLSIPEPCTQAWSDMTPVEDGRFCRHCCKKVTDFSAMTDEEIISVLSNTSQVCGRLLPAQLHRNLAAGKRKSPALFPAALLTSFIAAIVPGGSKAQDQMSLAGQPAITAYGHPVKNNVPIRFEGKVVDKFHNEGLPGVTIALQGHEGIGGITDKTGCFQINLPAGNKEQLFTLKISAVGYEAKEISFTYEQLAAPPVITLQQSVTELKELVVTGYATQRMYAITGAITVVKNATLSAEKKTNWWRRITQIFRKK